MLIGLHTGVQVPPHEPEASPHSAVCTAVTIPPAGHVSDNEMLAFGLLFVDPPDRASPHTDVATSGEGLGGGGRGGGGSGGPGGLGGGGLGKAVQPYVRFPPIFW